jgi:serine/threonine protein kinase
VSNSIRPDAMTDSFSPEGLASLFDRYEILGVIGQGGMGTVYKGYHRNLKRFVAIKVLRLDRIKSPELASRFLREMQAVGQMDHPNVVRATDAGQKDGLFYLVMEYLEGRDLSQIVDARGRLGTADACELVRQAALGLDYIHHTLVHRDIKPSNLLLTPAGQVKVLDLGLARLHEAEVAQDERTPQGRVLGTFDYIAPEQASGGGVDGRADIYGLGCTLYKLLTGRAPFAGPEYESITRKLYAHAHVPLTAAGGFPSIPEGLRPILLRMTAKDPAERFVTAGEVAQALAPFAAGSDLVRLSREVECPSESVVRPLPQPSPEELRRLTAVLNETRTNDPASPAEQSPTPVDRPPPAPRLTRRVLVGGGVLACVLAALAWAFGPTLFAWKAGNRLGDAPLQLDPEPGARPADELPSPTLRALDKLPPDTLCNLLDQKPLVVGTPKPRGWSWDKGQERIDVHGEGDLLFQLGTTARRSFTLQAGISQSPWTGNVGVFWGYREDAEARKARVPSKEFASFQTVCIYRRGAPNGGDIYLAKRGRCTLYYDKDGLLQVSTHFSPQQELPRLIRGQEIILEIAVERGRLVRATMGTTQLTSFSHDVVNNLFKADPYDGAVGLIVLSHDASFRNVRFIGYGEN